MVILLSHRAHTRHGAEIAAAAAEGRIAVELLPMRPDTAGRLDESDCARVEVALFSEDIYPDYSRQFFSAARKAPRLKWLHTFAAGVDHAVYVELLARGVRLTTSSGAAAEPIAHTAIMGMLALARRLPHWLAAQRRHAWEPLRGPDGLPANSLARTWTYSTPSRCRRIRRCGRCPTCSYRRITPRSRLGTRRAYWRSSWNACGGWVAGNRCPTKPREPIRRNQ